MTSKLTRERLQEIAEDGFLKHGESKELARMALAALDSEPVAEVVSIYGDPETFGEREIRPLVGIQQMPYGTKLYRHAQQPVVPATLPCSVELKPGLIIGKGCKTETLLTALRRRADYNAEIDAMTPEERAEYDANIEAFKAMLPQPAQPAQLAPVVPDGYVRDERGRMMLNGVCEPRIGFGAGWNACRAAMLQELKKVQELKQPAGVTKMRRC